jgi:adenosylmethionine-8-amino-7-oxononanoate aminotransferase
MTHLIYPTTNFKAIEQVTVERGEGCYVWDNHGNKYLEGLAGLWCTALGYGNQEVITAATEQMNKLTFNHMFGGKTHQVAIDLADKLADMIPMKDAVISFGNSGSDANDTHIKLLRYYHEAIGKPHCRKSIARERSYHGVTVAAASLTGLPVTQNHFDLPVDALGILRTDHPHYYRGKQGEETEDEFVDRIVDNLEAMILREGPDTIATFIAEPITGASGVIVPPQGYYQKVQAVLNRYDIMFWADEVITGFGRTGSDFGCNTMGIESPDMMTFAKQLSSAYMPISASAINRDMYSAMIDQTANAGAFGHGYTYSGHPVACAVALKVLEIYQRDEIFEKAAVTGQYMQKRLAEFSDHPLVGEVRGSGLLGAIELVADKKTGAPFVGGAVGGYAQKMAQDSGLLIRAVAGSSLGFCPPLIITEPQIDEMIGKVSIALDNTLEHCHQHSLIV